ncbi:MAG: ParB N-terminal domain-containing protein [Enhydrobacter sp.]|nr:ParB N-terminal domain-containing protein [Enhydrobacter sp.]
MTKSAPKITLSRTQDIPFNKLVLSQANVRRVKAGLSIENLAEDIARRGLLQSLSVRPVLDADGGETGMYEIPAGGRRYRALQRLVAQKRMTKTQAVPCLVRTDGIAEEDSLAENVLRVSLHPLDQFRAFAALREQGLGEDDIAARFFVAPAIVRQRLKLASVSPKLLDLYAEDKLDLEQLMAFTVSNDHARQEQVWEALTRAHNDGAWQIRRQLTEGAVPSSDRRAQFVGLAAYEAAGGAVMRDLFDEEETGWLQDPALLDRLTVEKLTQAAEAIRGEGWKWIEVAMDFPYGHTRNLHQLPGEQAPLTADEQARYDALQAEHDQLEATYSEADELPDDIEARLGEIAKAVVALDERPVQFDSAGIASAGVFVSLDSDGELCVERGYVRPEDDPNAVHEDGPTGGSGDHFRDHVVVKVIGASSEAEAGDETGDEGAKPLPDRLVAELTAHRTLALRDAMAAHPDIAFLAVLHALCLHAFYHYYGTASCLELSVRSYAFSGNGTALKDTAVAKAIEQRHDQWRHQLPQDRALLWDALMALDDDRRTALFAHCASLSINAVKETCNAPAGRLAHADQLARTMGLDMAEAGWAPTVDNYLGRVTKTRILEAVREACGEASAQLIEHLKKPDMAREAERLLAGTRWLPEPLRVGDPAPTTTASAESEEASDAEALPAFLEDDDATSEDLDAAA